VDRTARNTNMLIWQKELWLIDHGASLYFHHNSNHFEEQAKKNFLQLKDHVLLSQATELEEADRIIKEKLTPEVIRSVTDLIPSDWLLNEDVENAEEMRKQYEMFLVNRIAHSDIFINEARNAG
jgi:hypothetical protein